MREDDARREDDALRADEVKALFSRVQAGQPPLGIQAADLLRRGRLIRRRRTLTAAVAAVAAVCLLVVFWPRAGRSPVPPPGPVVPASRPVPTTTPTPTETPTPSGFSCSPRTPPSPIPDGAAYCVRSPRR
jgi:hypothetical protein